MVMKNGSRANALFFIVAVMYNNICNFWSSAVRQQGEN
jgi:hypothetical protein